MKSVYNFVVTPKGERYNNKKKIGDSELILNTEIFNHQYVNKEAVGVVRDEFEKEYGTSDVNIQDGIINYPENGEADKKD